jgi:N-methylhydantoinase A
LSARLRDAEGGLGVGRDKPIMVMEASGGLMTVESALARPVHTVLSGPAGGVVAGAHFAGLVEPTPSSPWISAAPAPTSA